MEAVLAGRPEKYAGLRTYFATKAKELRDTGEQEPFSKQFEEIEKEWGGHLPPSA
jgi:hypothetical protein